MGILDVKYIEMRPWNHWLLIQYKYHGVRYQCQLRRRFERFYSQCGLFRITNFWAIAIEPWIVDYRRLYLASAKSADAGWRDIGFTQQWCRFWEVRINLRKVKPMFTVKSCLFNNNLTSTKSRCDGGAIHSTSLLDFQCCLHWNFSKWTCPAGNVFNFIFPHLNMSFL